MPVRRDSRGHYEYNFMYRGVRHHRSFKGATREEVATYEAIEQANLRGKNYDIANDKHDYSLSQLINDFEVYAKTNYTRPDEALKIVKTFQKIVGNKVAEDVTTIDIDTFRNARKKHVKNSTINREINYIRRVFTLALANNKIRNNPFDKIKKLRIDNPPERFLSKEEEKKLLAVANKPMKQIIITALYTGMRQNELLSLKWADVFFHEGYIYVRDTKNNKTRKVQLIPIVIKALSELPRISEFVFISSATMTRYKDVKTTFSRTVKRANIPHISFHKLRHTTASRLNEVGVDIVTIKEILGHADVRTTQLYTHTTPTNIQNAFKLLSKFSE